MRKYAILWHISSYSNIGAGPHSPFRPGLPSPVMGDRSEATVGLRESESYLLSCFTIRLA